MTPLAFVDNYAVDPRVWVTPGVNFSSTTGRWRIVIAAPAGREREAGREWRLYEHTPPVMPGVASHGPETTTRRRLAWMSFRTPGQVGVAAQVLEALPPTRATLLEFAGELREYAAKRALGVVHDGAALVIDKMHAVAQWLRTPMPVQSEDDLMRAEENEMSTTFAPAPAPTPVPAIPDGWPPHYGRAQNAGGRWVVTVCGVATLLPAWPTEEEARIDAWERHAHDPEPELAGGDAE